MNPETAARRPANADERPPFGGSWRYWYAAVLLNLALLIALFAWLTRIYASR